MRIDAISLYSKYAETHQRLRPPNTLQPVLWNDLPPWLQAVWVELAIWISDQPIELAYSPPEDQETLETMTNSEKLYAWCKDIQQKGITCRLTGMSGGNPLTIDTRIDGVSICEKSGREAVTYLAVEKDEGTQQEVTL